MTITANSQSIHTTDGTAGLSGALFLCGCGNGDGGITDLTDVTVSDNLSTATSESGPAWVWGGGIFAARRHAPLAGGVEDRRQPVGRHGPGRLGRGGGPRGWPLGGTAVGKRPDGRPDRVDRDRQQRHRVTRRRGPGRRRVRRGARDRYRRRDREHSRRRLPALTAQAGPGQPSGPAIPNPTREAQGSPTCPLASPAPPSSGPQLAALLTGCADASEPEAAKPVTLTLTTYDDEGHPRRGTRAALRRRGEAGWTPASRSPRSSTRHRTSPTR